MSKRPGLLKGFIRPALNTQGGAERDEAEQRAGEKNDWSESRERKSVFPSYDLCLYSSQSLLMFRFHSQSKWTVLSSSMKRDLI